MFPWRRSIPLQIPYLGIHRDYEEYINYHESQATIQCHLNISKEMICERAHSGIVVKCVGGCWVNLQSTDCCRVQWIYGLFGSLAAHYSMACSTPIHLTSWGTLWWTYKAFSTVINDWVLQYVQYNDYLRQDCTVWYICYLKKVHKTKC